LGRREVEEGVDWTVRGDDAVRCVEEDVGFVEPY